jgi:hypothetical protein
MHKILKTNNLPSVAVPEPGPLPDKFCDELFVDGGKNMPDFIFLSCGLGVEDP